MTLTKFSPEQLFQINNRDCLKCGKRLVRRGNERYLRFSYRKFCSWVCDKTYKHNKPRTRKQVCEKCGGTEWYSKLRLGTDVLKMRRCKLCAANHQRVMMKAEKAHDKKIRYRKRKAKKYGLTEQQLDELETASCEICGRTGGRWTVVDHCHKSGVTRGFLCESCNWGLGHFKDSMALLNKAICYLRKHNAQNSPSFASRSNPPRKIFGGTLYDYPFETLGPDSQDQSSLHSR